MFLFQLTKSLSDIQVKKLCASHRPTLPYYPYNKTRRIACVHARAQGTHAQERSEPVSSESCRKQSASKCLDTILTFYQYNDQINSYSVICFYHKTIPIKCKLPCAFETAPITANCRANLYKKLLLITTLYAQAKHKQRKTAHMGPFAPWRRPTTTIAPVKYTSPQEPVLVTRPTHNI